MTSKHIDIDKIIIVILSLVTTFALAGCDKSKEVDPSSPYRANGSLKLADACTNEACYLGVTNEEARIMPYYKYPVGSITHSPKALLRELSSNLDGNLGGLRVRVVGYAELDLAQKDKSGTHMILPIVDVIRKGSWATVACRVPTAQFKGMTSGRGLVRVSGDPWLLRASTTGDGLIELKTCHIEWYKLAE